MRGSTSWVSATMVEPSSSRPTPVPSPPRAWSAAPVPGAGPCSPKREFLWISRLQSSRWRTSPALAPCRHRYLSSSNGASRCCTACPRPMAALSKVGWHHAGTRLPADKADMAPDPAEDRRLAASVVKLIPGLEPRPFRSERCLYDNSPDEDFVIDRVGRITIGAGTSGHGFKFGPLLGELLADLAQGRPPRTSTTWLTSSRPALRIRPSAPGGAPG
jgi:glycine/D-amino acid oxidase-like deaminating enzyme